MSASVEHRNSALRAGLERFQGDVNVHPQMDKVLRDWEPTILIECSDDAAQSYILSVRGRKIVEVVAPIAIDAQASCDIRVRGSVQTLTEIFGGSLSPVTAFDEGLLQIFASERDQIKIDTISLILWGV
jgi:hypothetical protein